jgi:hypothetical protein
MGGTPPTPRPSGNDSSTPSRSISHSVYICRVSGRFRMLVQPCNYSMRLLYTYVGSLMYTPVCICMLRCDRGPQGTTPRLLQGGSHHMHNTTRHIGAQEVRLLESFKVDFAFCGQHVCNTGILRPSGSQRLLASFRSFLHSVHHPST